VYSEDYSSVKLTVPRGQVICRIYKRLPLCHHCAFIQLYYWFYWNHLVSMHSV